MGANVDDGYIKYTSNRRDGVAPPSAQLDELNQARTVLFDLGLIGVYPNGVGFGNLSIRTSNDQFVITASATGGLRTLRREQFCLVESFSIDGNHVRSRGPLPASSESMTHGAIYAAKPEVKCVMHVHSRALFDDLLQHNGLATPTDVPYGTPAMARSVAHLVSCQPDLPVLFVMAGHEEGIVAYGADVASTQSLLLATFFGTPTS